MGNCTDKKKCDECSLETIIEEIKKCNFRRSAGSLINHRGYRELVKRTKDLQTKFEQRVREIYFQQGKINFRDSQLRSERSENRQLRTKYSELEKENETPNIPEELREVIKGVCKKTMRIMKTN